MIEYEFGDLFSAPKGAVLLHSCNTHAVWSKGVALQFAKRFPRAKAEYQAVCQGRGLAAFDAKSTASTGTDLQVIAANSRSLVGKGFVFFDTQPVACLLTSKDYGSRCDPPEMIVEATYTALLDVLRFMQKHPELFPVKEIHSPKINAGLFRTPWPRTCRVIEQALDEVPVEGLKWIVWELD